MAAIPANDLLEESKCYTCLGISLYQALELALLSRIAGGAVVAGTNTQVQFNDAGVFGASANFTFNKSTNALTVGNGFNGSITTTRIDSLIGGGFVINQFGGGPCEWNFDSDLHIKGVSGGDLYLTGDADGVFINNAYWNFQGPALLANGFQVLKEQQPAVANATGAGDIVAQFNALLARLRESTGHGLIAG